MTQIILIIIGIAIIVILLTRKTRERVVGICAAAIGLDAKKRENKEKILALLNAKARLSKLATPAEAFSTVYGELIEPPQITFPQYPYKLEGRAQKMVK